MFNLDGHTEGENLKSGLSCEPSGVPADDGSQAFKNHIKSRIEASYDDGKRISKEEMMTTLRSDRKNRQSRVIYLEV